MESFVYIQSGQFICTLENEKVTFELFFNNTKFTPQIKVFCDFFKQH